MDWTIRDKLLRKYQSVDVGIKGDQQQQQTGRLCAIIYWRHGSSQRWSYCDVCLVSLCNGIVLAPCGHWCFWVTCADAVSVMLNGCLVHPYYVTKTRSSRLLWQSTVNSSQLWLTGRSTRYTIMGCEELTVWRDDWHPGRGKDSIVSSWMFRVPVNSSHGQLTAVSLFLRWSHGMDGL